MCYSDQSPCPEKPWYVVLRSYPEYTSPFGTGERILSRTLSPEDCCQHETAVHRVHQHGQLESSARGVWLLCQNAQTKAARAFRLLHVIHRCYASLTFACRRHRDISETTASSSGAIEHQSL